MKKIKILSALLMMLCVFTTKAENSMYFKNFDINAGETKTVYIYLDYDVPMCSFQADIYLPEGLSISTKSNGKYKISIVEDQVDDHSISSALQADGAVRIIGVSLTNSVYCGASGDALISCTLVADESFNDVQSIQLKGIVLNDPDKNQYKPADTSAVINDYLTGVEETLADVDANAEYYNLQGVKVAKENLTQGIYIKNVAGKCVKVLIK